MRSLRQLTWVVFLETQRLGIQTHFTASQAALHLPQACSRQGFVWSVLLWKIFSFSLFLEKLEKVVNNRGRGRRGGEHDGGGAVATCRGGAGVSQRGLAAGGPPSHTPGHLQSRCQPHHQTSQFVPRKEHFPLGCNYLQCAIVTEKINVYSQIS